MEKENKDVELLLRAIALIENEEECKDFFSDLCTTLELEEMSRRLKAANMLSCGYQYIEVVSQTGLSTATISRVSRSLKNGKGYQSILAKLRGKI